MTDSSQVTIFKHLTVDYSVIQAKQPLKRLDSRAVPITNSTLILLDVKEIDGNYYGITGWEFQGYDMQFTIVVTQKLAEKISEQGRFFTPFVLQEGEILIPLGKIDMCKNWYGEFRILASSNISILYDE